MLPIAMLTGVSIYLLYHFMPAPVHKAGPFLEGCMDVLQPLLIFMMLFLTFCRSFDPASGRCGFLGSIQQDHGKGLPAADNPLPLRMARTLSCSTDTQAAHAVS